ncbi:hypothetical protein [Streptomyces sp. NPDC054887]
MGAIAAQLRTPAVGAHWKMSRNTRAQIAMAPNPRSAEAAMPEEAQLHGTIEKVGDQTVTVEVYKFVVDLDDSSREKLKEDPYGIVQRFLESQGHTVNGLILDPQAFDDGWPPDWSHIPSGEYKSHWFQKLL